MKKKNCLDINSLALLIMTVPTLLMFQLFLYKMCTSHFCLTVPTENNKLIWLN